MLPSSLAITATPRSIFRHDAQSSPVEPCRQFSVLARLWEAISPGAESVVLWSSVRVGGRFSGRSSFRVRIIGWWD